jgi:hypothetical protein
MLMETFLAILTVADYQNNPKEEMQKTDLLWKVHMLIGELNKRAKDMWIPGKWVTIDKQTNGCDGTTGDASDEVLVILVMVFQHTEGLLG